MPCEWQGRLTLLNERPSPIKDNDWPTQKPGGNAGVKPTAFIRSSMEMIASKDGRWLVLFSLAIGIALAWTYTPLFLTPLGVGMGAALFGADGSAVAFFAASALTYLANAAFRTNPHAKAALGYGAVHAAMGVIGGVLLVGSSLMAAPDAFSLPGTISDGIELGGEVKGAGMPLILDAWFIVLMGCIGASLAAFSSTCAVLQASRLLKRLSPARSVVACTGAFMVAATIIVCAAFVSGVAACLLICFVPVATLVLGHMADARVPYADLSRPGEKSLTLVPIKQKDAWRYGAISLGLFLMGGWALNNAGQYNHLPKELPAFVIVLQCLAVLVAFALSASAFQSRKSPIGYDLICRVSVPLCALSILLEFLPENNAGYLDDLGVCLTLEGLLLADLMCWVIHVCTARNSQTQDARTFCIIRAMTCAGAALAYIVVRWFVWAPLDKPKVAMAIGFLMLIVTIVCLPTAGAKVISVAASQPTSLRDLDEEKRERLSGLIVSHGLTAREAEVFALLVDDLDAATIAQRLSVSNATVHTHISHVYTKFGVHSRKELERVVQAGN